MFGVFLDSQKVLDFLEKKNNLRVAFWKFDKKRFIKYSAPLILTSAKLILSILNLLVNLQRKYQFKTQNMATESHISQFSDTSKMAAPIGFYFLNENVNKSQILKLIIVI